MINKAILQGRLTADPELKKTQSDIPVCSFTLAVDRRYKTENGPTADFINCVAWRNSAEFLAKYFKKGQEAMVAGSIQVRPYTDNAGNKRSVTEVQVDEIHFCGPKQQAEEQADDPAPSNLEFTPVEDDELPF